MHRKIKTIIVDDESRLRRGVERLVLSISQDWEVIGSYASGKECFEAFQENNFSFDLLITDVKMPGMDGLTLIKKLKEQTSFQSIVISGFDDFQFLQTAIREGASDYLIKPIDREEFKIQLEKIKEKVIAQWTDFQYREEIETKASQLTYVKQIQALSEVFTEYDTDLSLLEWTKGFPLGKYRLLYGSIDNLSSKSKAFQAEDWSTWAYAIENICAEMQHKLESSVIQAWRWKGEALSFWILLNSTLPKDERSFEEMSSLFADKLRLNIGKYTPFTISIAISQCFEDLTLLTTIKDELRTYIQFRLLYGGNQIFSNEVIEKRKGNRQINGIKEIQNHLDRIIIYFESNNSTKLKSELTSFLDRVQSFDSPEKIEESLHLLGIQIIHSMIKNAHGKDDFPLMKEVFGLTNKNESFTELRYSVYEWFKKVLHIQKKISDTKNLDPVDIARQWIITHLDQNITIQKIANHVYMNPTYFCEYFKNQTGETVLDFVTRIRMEKAKELLQTTTFKIYDIAVKVGYNDTKYFSKLFKKQYGDTPSKYKEKIILTKTNFL